MSTDSPRNPPRRLVPAAPPSATPTGHGRELGGVRIVVVDDDAEVLRVLEVTLSRAGALVSATNSAATALAALAEVDADILISDVAMPEEDGYSLMRWIRATDGVQQCIPAIALTGAADEATREKALAAGFTVCWRKPFAPAEPVRLVADLAPSPRADK